MPLRVTVGPRVGPGVPGRIAAFAALIVALLIAPASACTICVDPPARTTVNHLVAAQDVVLAREDPARPFRFTPTRVLRGSADGPPIPYLVDAQLRRRFASEPLTAVLFTRGSGSQSWQRLRAIGPPMRAVVDDVLRRGRDWLRPTGARERFETFAALHDHPDPAVRSVALSELDKTPWRLLRTLDLRLSRADLWDSLSKRAELPWVSVRLRLLALDPAPGDLERLLERLQSGAAVGATLHLEPLALAVVAAGGADAVHRLVALYGQGTHRTLDERSAVTSALAIHATDGDAALRPLLIDALSEMLESDAALAPLVAHTFDALELWSHAGRFLALLASGPALSPQDRFAVSAYVMRGRAAGRRPSEERSAAIKDDSVTPSGVRPAASAMVASALFFSPARAHEVAGVAGGLQSGFLHPLLGWKHVAAMVAVGLLGAVLGPPAIVLLPIVFPLVMAGGAGLGVAGLSLPAVEIAIAASAMVLGLLVAVGRRVPIWTATVIVAFFAIFHDHAHGTELPVASDALAYGIGFVIGTGLLHLLGIALGLAWRWDIGKVAVRAAGGMIAIAHVAFLTGVV